jgi:hypothetical protein
LELTSHAGAEAVPFVFSNAALRHEDNARRGTCPRVLPRET